MFCYNIQFVYKYYRIEKNLYAFNAAALSGVVFNPRSGYRASFLQLFQKFIQPHAQSLTFI